LDRWIVTQSKRIEQYFGYVIELKFQSGPIRDKLYFDQQTKAYVGYEDLGWGWGGRTIVLERSIKPIAEIPE